MNKTNTHIIKGNIIDIFGRKIYPGEVKVENGIISEINPIQNSCDTYILPGLIDSHVHIESSMLIPSEFARMAVVHGTVSTVSDPHEIANVLGIEGVRYMINNGRKVPFKFYFGAPSCVPATAFETAGAELTPDDIRELFEKDGLLYLSEMMNYPGVLNGDNQVLEKIRIAREFNRPVDGHAPGLRGKEAEKYIQAGISTDHECFTLDEALDKLKLGMKILIREGSAAKNFEALHKLIKDFPEMVMFCSDDKHPNDLASGHINGIVKRALNYGYDLFDILRCASLNPVMHYGLNTGLLRIGDPADFIVIDNPDSFNVHQTYIHGILTALNGKTLIESENENIINNFGTSFKTETDFALLTDNQSNNRICKVRVIEALDGQLITREQHENLKCENGILLPDIKKDILKLTVVERYKNGTPSVGFIKNFGLKKGAIASCVAHDSHNIIAVGTNDKDICSAVNALIKHKGGISAACEDVTEVLPLPVAGIMTNNDGYKTAEQYTDIDKLAKDFGSELNAPFMTLSFMALLVIPQLKLSDKGLFDGEKFEFVNLNI
ncbi:MAG: Adenine deaminase [Ignavibacteria bacterium]|nr:Adenine deaminase [Ignavibacteria bacterium]